MAQLLYITLYKVISKPSSTSGATNAQYDGLGFTLVDQVRGNTLQEIYHLMQFKYTQLVDLQLAILVSGFLQLHLYYPIYT